MTFIWVSCRHQPPPFHSIPDCQFAQLKILIRSISFSQYPTGIHLVNQKMKSLLLLFILLDNLANGEEQVFDGQAEIALEKALDDMRLGVTKEMATVPPSIRHPIPLAAPPRASAEQIGINSMNSSISPMHPPFVVLINPPSPLQMAKSHSNPAPLANFVVRPNEPKRVHKFEFMPHFDKENYEFMIPEGGQMEEDTLVAVLTFFGHLNGVIPKFDIKMDRMGWFSIGDVQTTQESNNYALSEVPILRRANAKINWTEIDNADGIYKYQVNGIQGPMNASAQIRVEILPTRNYTHLELEPTNEEEKKVGVKNITIGLGQSTVDENGKDENVKEDEAKEPGEDLLANEEMDEELLRMDPLGLIDLTGGDELFGIEEEQNLTIRVNLNGEQSRNGQLEVEFMELSTYLNNPVANFVVNFEEIHKNTAIDLAKNVVRLELKPANTFLDIRPHFIAPGDQANLWIVDPVKVAELTKGNGGEWQQQFKLFVHQIEEQIIGNLSSTMFIFNGSLVVKGGANPMPSINFINSSFGGYEFAINEEAKNGHVLGKLEVATTGKIDGRLVFSLYGQGAELFKIDEMGILRLDCHQNISSGYNSTLLDECLDREFGPSSFYFVASASITNPNGQNLVAPVPITIHLEDANDNPPRLELFNQKEMITILNGRMEGGPLVVAIRDEDSSPQNRENHLLLEGNCSKFFAIQQLKNSSIDLFAISFASESQQMDESCEHLELIAVDQDGQIDRQEFKISFKTSQQPIRFINSIYERSLNADKIHIGLPIVRMQLSNNSNSHREMNLNYAIIGGNPGWLAIEPFTGNIFVNEMPSKNGILGRNVFLIKVAAIQNHIKLAESLLKVEIMANSAPSHSDLNIKFPMPFIQMELERPEEFDQLEEEMPKSTTILMVPIFENMELARHTQLDGIEAWDSVGRPVELPKGIGPLLDYSPQNGSIQINSSLLGPIRSLHVHFKLDKGKDEEEMLLVLTFRSDPIKAEQHRRRLSRPRFAAPWVDEETQITIKIAEELPIGQPFFRLPALNPLTGKPISQIQLEGTDADSFTFDNKTGEIRIRRRLDFESSDRFQQISLIANSSESDQSVRAQIQIELLDVDDMPPKIGIQSPLATEKMGEIVHLEFEENPPKNKQLGILEVNDPDSRKHNCELVGKEADKFTLEPIKQKNAKYQWRLSIGQIGNDELDRERIDQIGLVIHCVDFPGQNRAEMPILLTLLDQNDNRPILSWAHLGQEHIEVAAKEWPKGAIITRFWARDQDIGENGRVQFHMGNGGGLGNELFRIDPENGELMAANDDVEGEERPLAKLAEMLAGQMLELEVVAKDNGRPSLSSSVKLRILLEAGNDEGQRELHWIWPDNEGKENTVIEVEEDVPEGRKIGKAEAIWRGGEGGEIFYKIGNAEEGGEELLRIDGKSGEIFTVSKLDYESRKHWTFLVTAFSLDGKEELNAIVELNVLNVDEYWPQFAHSLQPGLAKQTLYWPTSSNDNAEMFLGRVEAFDLDSAPFNQIVYSLMPKCSHPSFLVSANKNEPAPIRLNSKNGEIFATIGFPYFANISTVQICISASPADHPLQFAHPLDSVPTQSIIRLQLLPIPTPSNLPSPKATKTFPANNSHSILEHRLSLQRIGLHPSNKISKTNFSLHSVLFIPYGQSSSAAQKIGSMDAMRILIGIDPHEGELCFDPAILGAFGEGFYQFGLKMDDSMGPMGILNRNVHFVEEKHRLRLLFNSSLDGIGANLGQMIREFEGILSEKMGNQPIRMIHSEPIKDSEKPMFRSSMCFHLWTSGDSILGLNQTIGLISTNIPVKNSNENLAKFYEQNSVINVEPCFDTNTNRPGSSTSSILLLNSRSKEWLFWSCFGGISLLIFFGIFGYFCFVRTYREHLRRKSGDLLPADERSDSSTFHQYLNNQCSSASVFSVPEFIQAKALMNAAEWRRN